MSKLLDMTGSRFGSLLVTNRSASKNGRTAWNCSCDCGGHAVVLGDALRRGLTQSCGCLHKRVTRKIKTRHGKSSDRIYQIYKHMLARCHPEFPGYGNRGITVCQEWAGSFECFYADMGDPPSNKHTLDRIDNHGNYCKSNCRWATYKEQNRNRRDNRLITFNGQTLTLAEHCESQGLCYSTVLARLDRLKWSPEKALSTPIRKFHNRTN